MGRPEADLDPGLGPVQRFAFDLRKLRREAGGITYRQMARQVEVSVSTLSRAAKGEQLPSLAVALAYVRACGGDTDEWERRWREAVTEQARAADLVVDETVPSPYRGLARFDVGDAELFFGRDEVTDALVRAAAEHRVFAVFGPSGSGKSSLLRAGLIPRLRSLDGPHRPAAVRILTPGEHPLRTHATACVPAPGEQDTWLVVDQFEEVFTLCRDTGERAGYLARLLAAAEPGSRLRVVLGVRADFYGRCAEHRGLADALREANLLVGPMSPAELREAVVRPAQATGLIVERELTARLVAEVDGEPGGLPLLSHALRETWRRRRGRALTMEAYEAAGGVRGAIAQTAEEVYTRLSADHAELARLILLRLIAPGEGSQDTRRPVDRSELELGTASQDDIALVLDQLAAARLLTLNDTTVDLAHEALISAWPRMQGWIEDERDRLRRQRRLTNATNHWQCRGRDTGALLRGGELTEAEEAFRSPEQRGELTLIERDFLQESLTARARARRARHLASGAVALLTVLALVAGVVAWQQGRASEQRRKEATARRVAAVAQSMRLSDPIMAERLSMTSWALSETTETRSALLGALSQQERDTFDVPDTEPTATPELSSNGRTIVSVSAGQRTVQAWDVIGHRRAGPPHRLGDDETLTSSSPDGRSMLTHSGERARLWDVRTGKPLGDPLQDLDFFDRFGPSGRTAALTDMDGRFKLMDIASRQVLFQGRTAHFPVWAVSSDDRLLAVCKGTKGPLEVWDVAKHRRLRMPPSDASAAVCDEGSLQFIPGSRALASLTPKDMRVWDLDTGHERTRIRHKGLSEMTISPDGKFVVAADEREILLWRLASPEAPVFRRLLANETATQLRLDVRAGMIRYVSQLRTADVTVRSLSYGAAMTSKWNEQPATRGVFSRSGRRLALEHRSGDLSRFEVMRRSDGKRLARTSSVRCGKADENCYTLLALSQDGRTLAYGKDSTDRPRRHEPVTLWDVNADTRARSWKVPRGPTPRESGSMEGFMFTPDGRHLLIPQSGEDVVGIWDISRGKRSNAHSKSPAPDLPEAAVVATRSGPTVLAMRPDGRLLATMEQTFALPSGRTISSGLELNDLGAVAFSPDGSSLATGERTGWVALWDGEVKQRLGVLAGTSHASRPGKAEGVTALAFSPDGKTMAVAGEDGTLQLWDVASAQPLGSPLPTPGDAIIALAFAADGRTLHAAGAHSALRSYTIDALRAHQSLCTRAGGGLSRADWRKYIPEVPYRDVC
ncbi:helix-turn-helix domain-containing protein [Streptomyces alboflavus]|uniref:nSTAND1 domain-containing NTPase n=1 Tax=Streptomyces alboflavus TaxID=67267 RepID=UPI0004BE743E|nr:helix-turn-helix domain-containing protein [Streptomyces alboflavus]